MQTRLLATLCLTAVLALTGCRKSTTAKLDLPPLQSVEALELERYAGTWYEIASFPQRFQKGCTGTTAHYAVNEDGTIAVTNRCFDGSLEGKEREAEGRARLVKAPSQLEVSFFGPFWGDYWVIDLGEEADYGHAVVGHPGRDYLWILSRSPEMDAARYQSILRKLEDEHHYPLERLQRTLQPNADPS